MGCSGSREQELCEPLRHSCTSQTPAQTHEQPELLAGKRYCEDVDTYSFGIVLFEIAMRELPYRREISILEEKYRNKKNTVDNLLRGVAKGTYLPALDAKTCRKHGNVGRAFRMLFADCVKFDPRDRLNMDDVVRRLESVLQITAATPESNGKAILGAATAKAWRRSKEGASLANPWSQRSATAIALQSFVSRLEDAGARAKLKELTQCVEAALGSPAVDALVGVYNPPRLYTFLLANKMDVSDAVSAVISSSNARIEYKMDAKREHIVKQDLSFNTLPRAAEYFKYIPTNPWLGITKDGRNIYYIHYGGDADYAGHRKAFTLEEDVGTIAYINELYFMIRDARNAIEGRRYMGVENF